jgi:hypothetical protein
VLTIVACDDLRIARLAKGCVMLTVLLAAALFSQANAQPNGAQAASQAVEDAERRLLVASWPFRAKIWLSKSKDKAEF